MADVSNALIREFKPGTLLFEENDPGSRMYVIRKGRVKIFRSAGDKEVVLAFLGPGEFFGEMALLENLPRSASALVIEESELVEVDVGTFEEMIHRNIEIAVRIMRKLASRVRELDTRLEQMIVDDAQHRALEVLRWLLPQGILDGNWIRISGAAAHLDIITQAGIPAQKAPSVMRKLVDAGCLKLDGTDLLVAQKEVLDEYESYLSLKRKYRLDPTDPTHQEHDTDSPVVAPGTERAVQRLVAALQLSSDDVERQSSSLAQQYKRYLDLKKRFRDLESGK